MPSLSEVAQFITSLGVLSGIMVSWRNGKKADVNNAKIDQVHAATNGMKTELVNEVRAASLAKGELTGEAKEKSAQAERDSKSVERSGP